MTGEHTSYTGFPGSQSKGLGRFDAEKLLEGFEIGDRIAVGRSRSR